MPEIFVVTWLSADGYAESAEWFADETLTGALRRMGRRAVDKNACGFSVQRANPQTTQRFSDPWKQNRYTQPQPLELGFQTPKHLLRPKDQET